ncbi:hypothetical protein PEDI_49110 [Persicobacter diffluens]|uniref:Uncharacterized protein n=1 Tax=Persicobacter diffluens TaxID=981 RepID=A0AAN5AME9_9BACT|nr:hypothetical protein PEDI_49110 [Persicobacter diffluens]
MSACLIARIRNSVLIMAGAIPNNFARIALQMFKNIQNRDLYFQFSSDDGFKYMLSQLSFFL